ncbi:reverse transcriptase domain-containing protein [Tanacetum coccineum]
MLEAPTEGYEDAIVVPEITADNFELKHGLLTLVQNKQFFGHDKEDPHAHIRYFNKITSTMKFPNVPSTSVKLMLFPFSLEGAARIWLEKEPPRSILTWDDLVSKFINKFFPPSKTTNLRNEITRFQQRFDETFYEAWDRFNDLLRACPHHGFSELHQLDTFYNALNSNDQDSLNSAAGGSGTLPSNTITNPKWNVKRGGQWVTVPPTNNGSTKDVQPPVVQVQPQVPNSEPVVAPVSAPKPNPKPSIPYPSRLNDQKIREKANNQIEKFYQIFQDFHFDISFANALILMPKFASTLKSLISNKEKLFELARTPLNEHCSAVLLKKLPEKLGDPDKFLIPCDFPGMDECLALADLGASINLMPLSVWKKLSLPELTPTCMTLELADRSITQPIGIAEDVYVKVGKFQFPADFVVVDFDADPRVPLILRRSFLNTGRALIDVYERELTLRVGKEAVTFNLDQTSRYSSNYDDNSVNRIDVIEMACEEYSQEVLGFSDVIASGNPTPYYDQIVSTSSPTLTPLGDSDFVLKEVDAFLALEDDPTSPEVDDSYYDPEGDILLLEAFLNDDPSLPPPTQGNYFPEIRKELKVCKAKNDKSSIDEPSKVELKDLPPHLEYAFLEGNDKLPVIISKDLSVKEKAALIKVLKSHKRAIAWKLSDIKGINPEFCTHKILMEEDYKPAVQHQIRVNPKIHDVIKKVVEKLLDVRLIYPISDSPWQKLNEATRKDHFPLPFMDQMLERLAGNEYYCFLDGFSGYFQIPIDPHDQEKTTFTCPYGMFAYRRMPFGLCNAPGTFQRCMMAIFHDMIEKTMEVFMDDFLVFGNSFGNCLSRIDKMLQRCEDTNLCLNWEKSHFMVKEGIFLGHKISKNGIEVDKAKVDVIAKFPHPTTVKGVKALRNCARGTKGDNETFPLENLICDFCGGELKYPVAKKLLTSSKLAIVDPSGDITVPTTPPKRFLTQDFIGPQFTEMPMTWSPDVTLVSVKEKFRNVMKCLKIPSKFAKSLTCGASISWGRSRLHEGTNTYSWRSTTCQNGLKRKRSPPMTPELFANFLNLSSPDLVPLVLS